MSFALVPVAEAALFCVVYSGMALRRERALVGELLGALRGRGADGAGPGSVPVGDDHVLEAAALEARPGPVGEHVQ